MSALQHGLEWTRSAYKIMWFSFTHSTDDSLKNLRVLLHLRGMRYFSNMLRPVVFEDAEDPVGKRCWTTYLVVPVY